MICFGEATNLECGNLLPLWSPATCRRFPLTTIQHPDGCDRSQTIKALTGQRTPKRGRCRIQFPESPRTLTTNETKRKASRPANALSAIVTKNSIPSARFFGTIMGRASIINIKLSASDLFPLPEFAAWITITSDLPANFFVSVVSKWGSLE
jgi:hypothetical protein